MAQLAILEERLMSQVTIENTLTAKGFSDCVCSISDESVSIIVPDNEITQNSTLIIKDVVASACNVTFENISIITV